MKKYELKDLAVEQRKLTIKSMQSHISSMLFSGMIILAIAGIIAISFAEKTAQPSETAQNCIQNTQGNF